MARRVETYTPSGVMKPLGPYSHVAKAGGLIMISATAGIDPATNCLAGPDVYSQAKQIIASFKHILTTVGSDLDHVLHVNVYLKDMADFGEMNRAYADSFGEHRPARTAIAVIDLPKPGAVVTMNLTAITCKPE